MKFTISQEALLKPLQAVAGVVEKRQTMPVLSNVLMVVSNGQLSLTGTDTELELLARLPVADGSMDGEITVPARKLLDIVRSLNTDKIDVQKDGDKIVVKAGRSRFSLATLPANEFPSIERSEPDFSFTVQQADLRTLIDRVGFAMAQQDVRQYLNGMLFEVREGLLRAVATDGHRLAMADMQALTNVSDVSQSIVPRKAVVELAKLFADAESEVVLSFSPHHVRAESADLVFISRLLDGRFPEYERVLPKGGDKTVIADRETLKSGFGRASILCNEKFGGIRMDLQSDSMTVFANNQEQEEAEEQLSVEYTGDRLEIGFNVTYLLDVLNVLRSDNVRFILGDSNSSALVQDPEDESATYVVMPIRL